MEEKRNNSLVKFARGRKSRRTGGAFLPDMEEWANAIRNTAYNTQLCRHFGIGYTTLYEFLKREAAKEENDENYQSEYLNVLNTARERIKNLATNMLIKKMEEGDTASILFAMKTYNNMMETRDRANIAMRGKELELRSKQFLTEIAQKFNLSFEQLDSFAAKFFETKNNFS